MQSFLFGGILNCRGGRNTPFEKLGGNLLANPELRAQMLDP